MKDQVKDQAEITSSNTSSLRNSSSASASASAYELKKTHAAPETAFNAQLIPKNSFSSTAVTTPSASASIAAKNATSAIAPFALKELSVYNLTSPETKNECCVNTVDCPVAKNRRGSARDTVAKMNIQSDPRRLRGFGKGRKGSECRKVLIPPNVEESCSVLEEICEKSVADLHSTPVSPLQTIRSALAAEDLTETGTTKSCIVFNIGTVVDKNAISSACSTCDGYNSYGSIGSCSDSYNYVSASVSTNASTSASVSASAALIEELDLILQESDDEDDRSSSCSNFDEDGSDDEYSDANNALPRRAVSLSVLGPEAEKV